MIFADLGSPTAVQMNDFLLPLGAILALIYLGLRIMDHFKKKDGLPQPLTTREEKIYAERDHVETRIEEVKDDVTELRKEMLHGHEVIKQQTDVRFATLSQTLHKISLDNAGGIAELRGELKRIKSP